MRGKLIIALGIFLAFAGIFCQQVSAAFVDGIERFDGTVKDTETWEEYSSPPEGEVYQNNKLIFSNSTGEGIDCTTRNITVGVGDIVRVELLEHPSGLYAYSTLYLTTNSEGANRSTVMDDHFLLLTYSYVNIIAPGLEPGYYFAAGSGSLGRAKIQFFGKDSPPPSPSNPLILQIERTSSDSAVFSAFTSDMTLIDSMISSFRFRGVPDNLFISLYSLGGQGGYTVFDNVTIIPEPATVLLLGLGGLAMRRINRRGRKER